MALVYLGERFLWRIADFLRHWYIRSAKVYSNYVVDRLEHLDRFFAWKITLQNLFSPLYKDYTIVGYLLGFFLRSARLIVASVFYVLVILIAVFLYILWLLLPPFLVAVFLGVVRFH